METLAATSGLMLLGVEESSTTLGRVTSSTQDIENEAKRIVKDRSMVAVAISISCSV